MPQLINKEKIMTKMCQPKITMKTVQLAHCYIVNQAKRGVYNSQRVETQLDKEMTCPMTINQQEETRKTLPPSTRVQAAGVKATRVGAEKEKEYARKKDGV